MTGVYIQILLSMQKIGVQNIQSFSGISRIGDNHQSLMNDLESKQQILYTIKINGPQDGQLMFQTPSKKDEPSSKKDESEKGHKSISHKNPYELQTTGYDINRDLYSQQQIKQAFKVIDINKDGVLTFDQISFFLNCMGEQHSQEEVQEMINMISTDGKVVALDDFRKISKGKISPFAAMKVPDQKAQLKQTILNNILQANLIDLQPSHVIAVQESKLISFEQFMFEKEKKNEQVYSQIIQPVQPNEGLLRNRTHAEIQQKRQQFGKLPMLNIERIIQNLSSCSYQFLQSGIIAQLITIDQVHARKLFTDTSKKVMRKQVILDAILFSSKSPIEKLYLILTNYKREQLFFYQEWVSILTFMVGSDQKQMVGKKLSNLFKYKKIKKDSQFDKHYIVKVMSQQIFNFNC